MGTPQDQSFDCAADIQTMERLINSYYMRSFKEGMTSLLLVNNM